MSSSRGPVVELIGSLGQAMQSYLRSTQTYDDAVAHRLGLNPADVRCLNWLADGPKSAGALSAAIGLTPGATTSLIDRLSLKGFVRRIASPDDGRIVLVELTEAGMEQTFEMYAPLVADVRSLLSRYDTEDLTRLRDYFDAVRRRTEQHTARLRDAESA